MHSVKPTYESASKNYLYMPNLNSHYDNNNIRIKFVQSCFQVEHKKGNFRFENK